MKILLVGDPHIVVSEMDDAVRMRNQVQRIEREENPDFILWMGDLFDNFGLKDIEVERFWQETFDYRDGTARHIALVGNHDRKGDRASDANALQVFDDREGVVTIVDSPLSIDPLGLSIDPLELGGVGFLPFYFTPEDFLKAADTITDRVKTLFCHQALAGAVYDSGHKVEDGANAEGLPFELVVSGHIHTAQSFGKVWYPGSCRWRTAHDVNKVKSLWLLTIEDGHIVSSKEFKSECSPLIGILDDEESTVGVSATNLKARYLVDIKGSKMYIDSRSKEWKAYPNVRIRTISTEKKSIKVRESEGIEVAFRKYQEIFKPTRGTPPDVLAKLVRERFANV